MKDYNYSKPISFERQYADATSSKGVVDDLYSQLCTFEKRARKRTKSDEKNCKRLLEAVVLELYATYKSDKQLYITYSRGKNNYTQNQYIPDYVSFNSTIAIMGFLLAEGYADGTTGIYYSDYKRQSRIRAKEKLIKLIDKHALFIAGMVIKKKEIIVLKDKNKKLIEYKDTPQTIEMRSNLTAINALLEESDINLYLPNKDEEKLGKEIRKGFKENKSNSPPIDFTQKQLYRVFNQGKFDFGGRFYGGWWQTIPSKYRQYITIDRKHPVEIDFAGMQVAQLYALSEKCPPLEDPYGLDGYDPKLHRKIIKKTFSAMLNATDKKIQPVKSSLLPKGKSFKNLLEDIEKKHKEINTYFYSGVGIRLQRLDSDIAEQVMLYFTNEEIPVLPVHDSFLISNAYEYLLKERMVHFFEQQMKASIGVTVDDYLPDSSELQKIGAITVTGSGVANVNNKGKLVEAGMKEKDEYSNYLERSAQHIKIYDYDPD